MEEPSRSSNCAESVAAKRPEMPRLAAGAVPTPAYHQGMADDPEELAALQRLILMFVHEEDRVAFMCAVSAATLPKQFLQQFDSPSTGVAHGAHLSRVYQTPSIEGARSTSRFAMP